MKNIIILIILFNFTFVNASSFFKVEGVQQMSVFEQVYNKLEVSSRLPKFVEKYINRVSKQRSEVPVNVWGIAKDGLDYTEFKDSVINVLSSNFTVAELQSMINDYQDSPYVPILHLKVRNEIQLSLQSFNSSIINQINTVLISNGYEKIND